MLKVRSCFLFLLVVSITNNHNSIYASEKTDAYIQKGIPMHFSPHSLHPPVITLDEHKKLVQRKMKELGTRRPAPISGTTLVAGPVAIPLTTVSLSSNFDAFIQIQFPTGGKPVTATLLLDSGNSNLIIPNGEELKDVPGYKVLGTAVEPWGCPANVVQGPVQIVTSTGTIYEITDCVFYACTGENQNGERTANFGAGRIDPWSANRWNTPQHLTVTLQSPLSYNTAYPYAEIVYAPAETMFTHSATPLVTDGSQLILSASKPIGYTMMAIVKNYEWMSVVPTSLTVAGVVTGWPGSPATAFIDTGGGPLFLSDPKGFLYGKTWPHPTSCPIFFKDCNCVSDRLDVVLESYDGDASYAYTIDTSLLPSSVQGLTGVFCAVNPFMQGQYGMNIGGVSALFNRILIDYTGTHVGMAPKSPNLDADSRDRRQCE